MKAISGLIKSVKGSLGWNKARASCFMQMLLALFAVKTVNLSEIALAMNGKAKVESNYRRLQRFFALFEIDFVQIARWIFKLFIRGDQTFYLVMDRTNWYWGKKKINVFLLGIAYEGMALPLFWELLPKAGSSNFKEQKKLINQFIKLTAVLAIAFVWAHKVDEWKASITPIRWKQFRHQKRPQYSFFRYGLDHLREAILNIYDKFIQLKQAFLLIFPQKGLLV